MKTLGFMMAGILLAFVLFISVSPSGRAFINNWKHSIQKADDATNYKTRKLIEGTSRAMISSYNSDKLVYIQYKDSENTEERSWGQQAKMRANKTASSYNNYILVNSYKFEGNVPNDINIQLPYLK